MRPNLKKGTRYNLVKINILDRHTNKVARDDETIEFPKIITN